MGKADTGLLAHLVRDRDPRIRRAVIQIAEPLLAEPGIVKALALPLADDPDPAVAMQLILSLGIQEGHGRESAEALEIIQRAARKHPSAAGVRLAATLALWGMDDLPLAEEIAADRAFPPAENAAWKISLGNWNRGLEFPEGMPDSERRAIAGGEVQYFQHCAVCHGADGKGLQVPGTDLLLAPSLDDSARVAGDPDPLIRVLLHGLVGPIGREDLPGRLHGPRPRPRDRAHRPPRRAPHLPPLRLHRRGRADHQGAGRPGQGHPQGAHHALD